jgi:hypothetical protein
MRIVTFVALASLVVGAACAKTATSSTSSSTQSRGPLRWSGNLQPTQQRTGNLAVTGKQGVYGTVLLLPATSSPNRSRVQITVSSQASNSTTYRWALLPGRCGSPTLPTIGFEQFPPIEISNNGRGSLDMEMALTLPTNGQYHVNVYERGQQLSDVLTCSNLKMGN